MCSSRASLIRGLIVAATGALDDVLEELDHPVVETNRDLRLSGIGLDDRAPLRAREIDVAMLLSYDSLTRVNL